MCHVGDFNLSYASVTGHKAREHLRNLKANDPTFWAELTQEEVDVSGDAGAMEDESTGNDEDEFVLFDDDSSIPLEAIIATVAGCKPAFLVAETAESDITSAARAETTQDFKEDTEPVAGPSTAQNVDEGQEEASLGRGK